MKKIISFILLLTTTFSAELIGQEIQLQASAPAVVEVGERFSLTYTLNANGSNFQGPSFDGFRYIAGPGTSSSSSTQIINNKVTQSVSLTFTYYLQSTKEGTFSIGPAKVTSGGKEVQSNRVNIKVVKSSQTGQSSQAQPSVQNRQDTRNNQTEISDDDIFIRAIVSNMNPYQGEQVVVTYKIYTRIAARSPMISKAPTFPGFWSVELENRNRQLQQQNEIYQGKEYVTAEINRVALFPQKSGKLPLEPMHVDCEIQVQSQQRRTRTNDPFFDRFFNDSFFGNRFSYLEKTLISNPVTINVKPLPLSNKPANFSGAVGNFDMTSGIDHSSLKTNEPITLKVSVTGKGNLDLIDELNISFPPDFEVYDPKVSSNIRKSNSGISGSRTFEYLAIPRNPGSFVFKPVNFSYFDPVKKQFITLTTPEYHIEVEKGEGTYSNLSFSGVSQEDVKYIGSDIRHIQTGNLKLQKIGNYFFGSIPFYLLIIIPLVLVILMILIWKSREKKRKNVEFIKYKKATKVARKNLKKAHGYLKSGQKDEFFVEVSQALWGYLGNKFNIPRSKLSIDTVQDTLSGINVRKEIVDQFIETLEHTEFARFAPGDSGSGMESIYNEALEIISKIERELR